MFKCLLLRNYKTFMYSLALIIFVVSKKKAFEHFPIGSNVNLCIAVAAIFFSETTWIIETKLPRNDHWKVLYKVCVFYADRKSKMATTTGHRLTLDPMAAAAIFNFISEQKTYSL
jgi:hypothetical protein